MQNNTIYAFEKADGSIHATGAATTAGTADAKQLLEDTRRAKSILRLMVQLEHYAEHLGDLAAHAAAAGDVAETLRLTRNYGVIQTIAADTSRVSALADFIAFAADKVRAE